MELDHVLIRGATRAQPALRRRPHPEEEARRADGRVGLGQVVARLRHPLRRGAAPLRRVALGLRAPVPRADGEAALRHDPRPVADHLDRAEDHGHEPALDRRHHHRDLRLPARAVRAGRHPALPRVRQAGARPDRRADREASWATAGAAREAGADGAAAREPQGRAPRAARRGAALGLRAPARRRRDRARARRSRPSTSGASTPSRRWSTASSSSAASSRADRIGRDRPARRRGSC